MRNSHVKMCNVVRNNVMCFSTGVEDCECEYSVLIDCTNSLWKKDLLQSPCVGQEGILVLS